MLQISNLKIPLFITHVFLISPALEVSHVHGMTFTAGHWAGSWLRFEGSDLVMSQCVERNGNGMSIIFDSLFIVTLVALLSFHNFLFYDLKHCVFNVDWENPTGRWLAELVLEQQSAADVRDDLCRSTFYCNVSRAGRGGGSRLNDWDFKNEWLHVCLCEHEIEHRTISLLLSLWWDKAGERRKGEDSRS